MDWITIYITGKEGFKEEVARRLDHSRVPYMPGYLGNTAGATDYDMYWLDKDVTLRSLKLAVGAKAIWKYRIRFYLSLEEFITSQEKEADSFTAHDMELIREMRRAPLLHKAS